MEGERRKSRRRKEGTERKRNAGNIGLFLDGTVIYGETTYAQITFRAFTF